MASLLEGLPDLALLNIFKYLDIEDISNLCKSSDYLGNYCSEYLTVSQVTLKGQYYLGEDEVKEIIRQRGDSLKSLNLNHCTWLSSRLVSWIISHCPNLQSLSVLECRLKVSSLVTLVARLPHLTSLAFSVRSFNDLKKDVFTPCRHVLRELRTIYLYYSSRELSTMYYLGEHTTVFDYCDHLEHVYIGSAGMAIPELYRPIVTQPERFTQLKSMCITSNIHAGAQMLYYGTLSQLPNVNIKFQSLIMPNVNFSEFIKKPDFRACLKNMEHLKYLDVFGSKVTFPKDFVCDLILATGLEYLNLGASRVTAEQLEIISGNCPQLKAVNLFNCADICQISCAGIEALFSSCLSLKHLNIGGEHHNHPASRLAHSIKGLQSLCIPTCILADKSPEKRKRSAPWRLAASPSAKKRCLTSVSADERRSASPPDDARPSTSSGQGGSDSQTGSFLEQFVKKNPDLLELEIIAADLHSAVHQNRFVKPKTHKPFSPEACMETRQVSDSTLEPISQLTVLHRLTLMGLPGVNNGQSLLSIATHCSRLTSLQLGFMGSALNSGHFYEALSHLGNLLDLRIEQPNMNLRGELFQSLAACTKIQRLCIIAKYSAFTPSHVSAMVEQLRRLVWLQIFAGGQANACKTLVTSLKHKYSKTRPAFHVAIHPLLHDRIAEMIVSNSMLSAQHFDEITRFCSRVATIPRDFNL